MKFNSVCLLLVLSLSLPVYSKRIVANKTTGMEKFKDKHWLNQNSWFKIVPLEEILKKNSKILYTEVIGKIAFEYPEYSIALNFPHKGYFKELFILSIPDGMVQGEHGYIFIDQQFPEEFARGDRFECLAGIPKIKEKDIQKVAGRVAVIAQHGADKQWANYYHWICEVLGRLALLEIAGVEYDWLYVGTPKKFMKETLELWGIDSNKIIEPTDANFCIQADKIIFPSMVINTSCGHKHAGNFQHPITLQYVREKLLTAAQQQNIDTSVFSKRVFISRKDAYNARRILNEDEIFDLFSQKGFQSYQLSKMSVSEQIMLLHNADIVVSEQGSGLTNILFCKEKTLVVELFQALIDNCFWWISNVCKLPYIPVLTISVNTHYFANFRDKSFLLMYQSFNGQINVPLDNIKKVIEVL